MTLNPLVEKILESTVQKGLDMSVLNELEFTPDDGCELKHCSGEPDDVCAGTATYWRSANLHKAPPQKVCENDYKHYLRGLEFSCGNCRRESGKQNPVWQCWHYDPIVK